jgi:hypothetical protein
MASGAHTGGKVLTGCSCLSIFIFLSPPLTALFPLSRLNERLPDMHKAKDRRADGHGLFPAPRRSGIGFITSVALLLVGLRAAGSAA